MASTYLNRTPASAGNRKTFTISAWVKRSNISSQQTIISAATGSLNNVGFSSSGNFTYWEYIPNDSTEIASFTTTQLFRDVSAWYHFVLSVDTTQSTSTNRVKIYVNGSQITSFSTSNYPSQNTDFNFNNNVTHQIGRYANYSSAYFDGSMANIYMIDGTALTPSSFGETDATTGIWKPKAFSGSYGTNGFFLKFENSGSLGTDSSGNGNNFTVNGTPTQTLDTPSNVFATGNPLYVFPNYTATNGNNTLTNTGAIWTTLLSSLGVNTGKWYVEAKCTSGIYPDFGILNSDGIIQTANINDAISGNSIGTPCSGYYGQTGTIKVNGTVINTYSSYGSGNVLGMALDLNNNKIYFHKDGTYQASANPSTGTNGISITGNTNYLIGVSSYSSSSSISLNFGNGVFGTTAISSPYSDGAGLGKFQYQPPTGYYSLCTKNINVYG